MYQNMSGLAAQSNLSVIDLRSDTVTQPSPAMRAFMMDAEVGDDVYGDDTTINALEAKTAALLGKEAGLFLPSSTMSNLAAMMAHTQRGEEIIVGRGYHIFKYEAGGSSVLGGAFPYPLEVALDGGLEPNDIDATIKPDDPHFPMSRVLSLENTHTGQAVSLDRINACLDVADKHGLTKHLDGARFFNAITKLGISPTDLASRFDSINICLSKGLGAPVGAVLVGSAATIAAARRWRKMLGGGMRQAGLIAAAGIYALDKNVRRLKDDHDRAATLANELTALNKFKVTYQANQTNMVYIEPAAKDIEPLRQHLGERGINMGGGSPVRIVMHLDIDDDGLTRIIDGFKSYYS
ncbi:low-specificity L-threonine aldolase [Maritalea porphyrae]|uniref:low-specificity L-threonine aldolase n=1 Tax=Maritalea porphyrae TaxID=880732 RepID=UPI0022AFCD93|nr:low-specificity L-threonine aldolase [Maritalea porphyrae]MCZ4273498.1 low-specificity L-threonine aldolase [Maritalea porphyrae]